jgi:hypothetical protein
MVKARSERKMMAKIKSRFPIFAHLRCSKCSRYLYHSLFANLTELKSVAAKRNLLKQAEKLEGTSPDVPKFFGSAGALPSRKTIR